MKILGKFAIYKGKEYQFLNINDDTCSLISDDEKDIDIGFQKIRTGRYVKYVKLEELDFLFEKKTIVKYKGDEFIGSVIEGDKIMLYTRNTLLGKKYNMIMRDKDEYYLYINLEDTGEIIQQWMPLKKLSEN